MQMLEDMSAKFQLPLQRGIKLIFELLVRFDIFNYPSIHDLPNWVSIVIPSDFLTRFKRLNHLQTFIINVSWIFFSEPHTEILGGDDMHVDWGSTINLTCVSKFNPAPPVDVIWYHNNKVNIELDPYFVLKIKN